jgi:protein-S-isoprenylcysteine O-methyltransferase Ste14
MTLLDIFPLVSFLVFVFLLTGRILYLRKQGIRLSPGPGKKPWFLILLYPVFGVLFLLWLAELVLLAFQLQALLLPEWVTGKLMHAPVLEIIGVAVIIIALLLLILTLLHFKWSLRFGLDDHNQGELITSGVFSHSRNPFFLSVNLYFTGLAFLHISLLFIIMAALTLGSIHFFILKEERFLHKYYGGEYRRYAEKVGRYF